MDTIEFDKKKVDTSSKKKQKGATMVEYAIMVGLVAVVAIVAVRVLGQRVSTQFSSVASQLGN